MNMNEISSFDDVIVKDVNFPIIAKVELRSHIDLISL